MPKLATVSLFNYVTNTIGNKQTFLIKERPIYYATKMHSNGSFFFYSKLSVNNIFTYKRNQSIAPVECLYTFSILYNLSRKL